MWPALMPERPAPRSGDTYTQRADKIKDQVCAATLCNMPRRGVIFLVRDPFHPFVPGKPLAWKMHRTTVKKV